MQFQVLRGSVVHADADAIVNAANSHRAHVGGLARAIADSAGPVLIEESARFPEVAVGSAVATGAGDLQATWVIHAVGPVWSGGRQGEPDLLASAYRSALAVAAELGARSVAFPSISTGIFGYPLELAAPIAISSVREQWTIQAGQIDRMSFHLFGEDEFEIFRRCAEERTA